LRQTAQYSGRVSRAAERHVLGGRGTAAVRHPRLAAVEAPNELAFSSRLLPGGPCSSISVTARVSEDRDAMSPKPNWRNRSRCGRDAPTPQSQGASPDKIVLSRRANLFCLAASNWMSFRRSNSSARRRHNFSIMSPAGRERAGRVSSERSEISPCSTAPPRRPA